jgi:hypothetical protein
VVVAVLLLLFAAEVKYQMTWHRLTFLFKKKLLLLLLLFVAEVKYQMTWHQLTFLFKKKLLLLCRCCL